MCMTMRIISRKEAIQLGLRTFFTGKPCKNGHVSERVVSTYRCVECKRSWEQQWRKDNPDKDQAIRNREVRKNRDGYLRRFNEYAERKDPDYIYKQRKTYRQQNKARVLETCREREARKKKATPLWYEKDQCVALYEEAARLTEQTGRPHQVDHIIPLSNELVCGLHCRDNLQILLAEDNLSKSNKLLSELDS